MDASTDLGQSERLRGQLLDRRAKLRAAMTRSGEAADLVQLLSAVDAALDRIQTGTYGACEICEEPIAEEDLLVNPLIRYCLCELTPDQQKALEADLELARRIQSALLPVPDQTVGDWEIHYRYEPHGPVSGDYCDLISGLESDEDVFFVVGDVSGKGIAAAILMAHLNASFRSLLDLGLTAKELVERADRVFYRSTLSSQFATLVCGHALGTGEVEICNAGHCPPLVVRRGRIEPVDATGLPVGMFGGRPYSTKFVKLEPGESLIFYTDGVTEARDAHDEEYGVERLHRVLEKSGDLEPRRLADACLEDLAAFGSGAPRADDLSLMIMRRRS